MLADWIKDIIYAGASDGLIHIIDNVLTMPVDAAKTAMQADLRGYIEVANSAPTDPQLLGALGPISDWTLYISTHSSTPTSMY